VVVSLAFGCLALLIVVWPQHSEGAAGSQAAAQFHATYGFTCCQATDINIVRHPGETIVLHWVSTSGSPSPARPVPITLSASITGPFRPAEALKKVVGRGTRMPPALEVLNAQPVHTSTWSDRPLLSAIAIPPNAPTGLYDIKFSVAGAGAEVSGDSVITVAP
jgi:hypothetical protein